ncbi:DEAD/DEAH box helicase [Mucilaginibacter celer]|uniref:DNA 3'-5' helicase n=1 Tax=Mucilaginibacter celer TaxID=2305508 RepID=A0A494VSC0_9SPHI|nr:DEAD/DEAH box helicase [Mucilaginibacter celer]AYL94253.1 DEAD/DEAH box helicase [Mucilaginibacter celer]
MKKYTANYTYTNPNFVIQNLVEMPVRSELLPLLYVLKNILQRGFPTTLSQYLQGKLGAIHDLPNFADRFLFASCELPEWKETIKGDKESNYFPAKDFFEKIIPIHFGEFAFVKSLIIPEIGINDLVGEHNPDFTNQQVDFYLPQAKLVIEIDGQQHKADSLTRVSDVTRDNYLNGKGIQTIRVTTNQLRNHTYHAKIGEILDRLRRYEKLLNYFREACHKHETNTISEEERLTKLLPTAVIRFQVLLLELLINNYLDFTETWRFNILVKEDIDDFAELAVRDLFIWIGQLYRLKYKQELKTPDLEIGIVKNKTDFKAATKTINIDFSLFNKYTDENLNNPDILYVRTDYFDIVRERNYFRVSTTDPVNYGITDEDKKTLEFFLFNIFGKQSFREGQFPIIQNALNRRDTIGLLPTGGGKSLCYQLPCILQPAVNFVVCPIKSLMADQFENLSAMLITNVAHINSDLPADARRAIELDFEKGRFLFVWISPEKFQIPSFRDKIRSINANFSIAYAVVDEVHCLSEWGHDFRTSYLNLARTIDKLSPRDESGEGTIKFIGLTATASVNVLKDIKIEFSRQKQRLADENIKSLLDYSRKELVFEVMDDFGNKSKHLQDLLKELVDGEHLTETTDKAGIVFTPNVNGASGCYQISNFLNTLYPHKSNWFAGDVPKVDEYDNKGYKTGRKIPVMSTEDFKTHRAKVQGDFKKNVFPLMVATKAFGMGIDKSNIHYTIHYGLPGSVEALYQEAGRAGRWDKRRTENAGLNGKCFVLYSKETHDDERVQQLFDKDTKFSEMKAITEEAGFAGKDILKQVFLFIQGQNDITVDFRITLEVLDRYYKPGMKKMIFWDDAWDNLHIRSEALQKAIYRLSLLGIVADWTTNFINQFEVDFNVFSDDTLLHYVAGYINKYEPSLDVPREIRGVQKASILEQSLWFLLRWVFENISYNRKQSLKTLMDWCNSFENNESFKRRIDSYFIFSEVTFILQHISENPLDFDQWFAALSIVVRGSQNEVLETIYLPGIKDRVMRLEKFGNLRDGISRFLESYRNNAGLNFLSGIVRLFLNEYQDTDGGVRFESAVAFIQENFRLDEQENILAKILDIGRNMDEVNQVELCGSLTKFYPERLEFFAEYFDLPYLLTERYEQLLRKIRKLNTTLHEQLAEI